MKNIGVYARASLIKLLFWIILFFVDATMISIREDTSIALILWLLSVFLICWWASYFIFYRAQWLFTTNINKERLRRDSYKCSFLFWLFMLINVLLLIAEFRSKWIGIWSLILFVIMQYFIFTDPKRSEDAEIRI
jgi:hypothetical protein